MPRPVALVGLLAALSSAAWADEYALRPLSGPRADVAALILGGGESGALRATGLALPECMPSPPESGDSDADWAAAPAGVLLTVEVEGRSLLDAVAAHDRSELPDSVRVELYAYALTQTGEILDSSSAWVRLPVAELADRLPAGGVRLVDQLQLPPGEYQVRVLVREALSQRFALRVLSVEVPSPRDRGPQLALPVFTESRNEWLHAVGPEARRPRDLPAALPVLAPGAPRPFALRGCRLTAATVEARLLTRDRRAVPGAAIRIGAVDEFEALGEIEVENLEAGLYLLEITARTEAGESTRTLPVFVADTPGAASWAALGAVAPEPDGEGEVLELGETRRSSQRVEAIEDGYIRVLEHLAAGRLEPAVTALESLERTVIQAHDNPRKAQKWLAEAQNRVTRRLLRHDPECLLPLMALHLELHARYAATDTVSTHLLNATRSRIRALAEVYASEASQSMAPALAAMSLVDLAAALERSGQFVSTLIVLREALALDRSNTDVLLDLAFQYEHHGLRPAALEVLQRLLELDPRSDEGRLRLAHTLLQQNESREGVALLHELIDDGSSEWVLAVAYQELARHLLAQQRFDEAARLLETAVRRFPDVQRLHIALAYALDRAGRRADSRQVVAGLPADRSRPSPRLRYRIPDRREDLRSRDYLLRHTTARLPLLAAALAESGVTD